MSVAVASEYTEAVSHLPQGTKLVVEDVAWEDVEHSHSFPFLSAQTLNTYLEQGLLSGERRAAKAFREWIKTQTEHS